MLQRGGGRLGLEEFARSGRYGEIRVVHTHRWPGGKSSLAECREGLWIARNMDGETIAWNSVFGFFVFRVGWEYRSLKVEAIEPGEAAEFVEAVLQDATARRWARVLGMANELGRV